MTVTNENFLDWANYVDVTRLPLAEGEIDALQSQQALDTAEITQQGQTFNDWLTQHDVTIQVAQDSADNANTKADSALIGLTNLDLTLQAYIDGQIAALHSQLTSEYSASDQNTQNVIQGSVDSQIGAISPSLIGELDSRIDVVNAQMTQRMNEIALVNDAVDQVTNSLFPTVDARLIAAENNLAAVRDDFDAFTFDIVPPNLVTELDLIRDSVVSAVDTAEQDVADARLKAEQDAAALFPVRCKAPLTSWTNFSTSTSAPALRTAVNASFLVTDTNFGECITLDPGLDRTLGHASPVSFKAGRVYKISAIFKCSDNGTAGLGCSVFAGVTTFTDEVVSISNLQKEIGTIDLSDGVVERSVYFSTDQAKLDEIEDIYGPGTLTLVVTSSANATDAFFLIRQNPNGYGTDGTLRFHSFAVQDVTDAQDAARLVRTELTSAINGVSSTLTNSYMTAVDTDAAIAAAKLDLKTSFQGGILAEDFRAGDLYWTSVADQPPEAENTFSNTITLENEAGIGNFLRMDASSTSIIRIASRARIPFRPGATLRITVKLRHTGAIVAGNQVSLQFRGQAGTYGYVTNAAANRNASVADVWEEVTYQYVTHDTGAWANVAYLQIHISKVASYVNPGAYLDIAYIRVEDLTEVTATNANLQNNYYTKSSADGAIAAAITNLQTEMESPTGSVGSLSADLSNNYYTKSGTDAAVAAAELTLNSRIDVDIASQFPDSFEYDDRFWSSSITGSPEAAAALYSEVTFPTEAGLGKFCRIPLDDSSNKHIAPKGRILRQPGMTLRIRTRARLTKSVLATSTAFRLQFRALTGTYSSTGATATKTCSFQAVNVWEDFEYTFTIPDTPSWDSAVYMLPFLYRDGGFQHPGDFIDVQYIKIEDISESTLLSADIENNYYTKTDADSAIAAQITSFQSALESPTGSVGSLQADLDTNYYTIAEADAAIVVKTTELKSQLEGPTGSIGSVTADLQNNYYTKTGTDNAIAAELVTFESALNAPGGSIGVVTADLDQNYYTKADADSAIATELTTLKANWGPAATGCLVSHPTLTDNIAGKWTSWGAVGGTLTISNNAVYPEGKTWRFNLGASNNGGLYTSSAWSNWVGPENLDGYVIEVDFTLHSGTLTGAKVRLDWDKSGGEHIVTKDFTAMTINGSAGSLQKVSGVFLKPSNFSGTYTDHDVYVFTNYSDKAAKDISIHRVFIRAATPEEMGNGIVADTLTGEINSLKDLTVSDTTAFGTMLDELNVSANGVIAGISNFGTAMADIHGNAQAAYVMRAKAGGSAADFEMVAWDNATGGGSAIRMNAEHIILEGTVSMSKLLIGDVENIASGSTQDWEGHPWSLSSRATLSTTQKHSGTTSLRISGAGSTTCATLLSPIHVVGGVEGVGDEFVISYWAYRDTAWNGTSDNSKLRFAQKSNNTHVASFTWLSIPKNTWTQVTGSFRVSNAAHTELKLEIWSDATIGNVYIDDIVVRRKKKGELLVDGTITGDHIVADSVATKLAQATTAYIGNAHIAERLTTDSLAVGGGGNLLDNSTWAAGTKNLFLTANNDASMAAQCSYRIRPYTGVNNWAPRNGCLELKQDGVAGADENKYWEVRLGAINSETDSTANKAISVEPSAWYEFQAHISTHRCTGYMYVFWYNTSWTNVGTPGIIIPEGAGSSDNPDGWPFYSKIVQAPSTAYYAVIVFRKFRTKTGFSNSYMFVHKPMLAKTHAGASEVSEYKPSGMTYITKDQVLTKTLTADEIQLDELTLSSDGNGKLLIKASGVDTVQVKNNAISSWGGTVKSANSTINADKTWTGVIATPSLTLSGGDQPVAGQLSIKFKFTSGGGRFEWKYRIKWGTSVKYTSPAMTIGSSGASLVGYDLYDIVPTNFLASGNTGTSTFNIEVYVDNTSLGGTNGINNGYITFSVTAGSNISVGELLK